MKKYGISIHEAASYVIGLVAMDRLDLCAPPAELVALFPKKRAKKENTQPKPQKSKTNQNGNDTVAPSKTPNAEITTSSSEDSIAEASPKKKKRKPKSEYYKVEKIPVLVKLDYSIKEKYLDQWSLIAKKTKGIRVHAFYRSINDEDWGKRKRRSLTGYAAILKEKDTTQPIS